MAGYSDRMDEDYNTADGDYYTVDESGDGSD
jgi:hypothetical protein